MQGVRSYKLAQLSELRMVCQEVGTLSDARALPLEVRRWWLDQMTKKDGGGQGPHPSGGQVVERDGKRYVTKDVR